MTIVVKAVPLKTREYRLPRMLKRQEHDTRSDAAEMAKEREQATHPTTKAPMHETMSERLKM